MLRGGKVRTKLLLHKFKAIHRAGEVQFLGTETRDGIGIAKQL